MKNMKKLTVLPLALAISAALASSAFAAENKLDTVRGSVEQGFKAPTAADLGFSMRNSFGVNTFVLDDRDFAGGDGQEYTTMSFENKGSYSFGEQYSMNWWVKVADGVMGYDYGNSDGGGGVDEASEITISNLYARIKNETLDLQVGIIDVFFGNAYNLQDDAMTGIGVIFRPAQNTAVNTFAVIIDENDDDVVDVLTETTNEGYTTTDGNSNADGDTSSDEYRFGVEVAQAFEGGGVAMYYIKNYDSSSNDDQQTVGLAGKYKTGDLAFEGEAATFMGDNGSGTDYAGTILQLGTTYNLPSGNVNANFYYSDSVADDESKLTAIYKKGMVQPMNQGLGRLFDHSDGDIQMLGKPSSIFGLTDNGGVIGLGVNGTYMVSKPLTLTAGLIYLTPENEDGDSATDFDPNLADYTSLTVLNAAAAYSFSEYLMAGVGVSYKTFSAESGSDLDDGLALGASMQFSF